MLEKGEGGCAGVLKGEQAGGRELLRDKADAGETIVLRASFADPGDWRTLTLILGVYILWGAFIFGFGSSLETFGGPVLVAVLLAPLLTLYCSLQHEVIHGHPFKSQVFNDALVFVPLALIIPYPRFKATHLRHHIDPNLCDPYDDPESWYLDGRSFDKLPRGLQLLLNANNTFIGRLVIGPVIGAVGFLAADLVRIAGGEWRLAVHWLIHMVAVALLLALLGAFGGVSLISYLLAAYLSMSLLMVRTFAEHQSEVAAGGTGERRGRSIIVEKGGFFAFLFLNNSLHAVHHALPRLAWYRLPARYRAQRERFERLNRGYKARGYGELFLNYAFRRKEPVSYPPHEQR